MNSRIAPLLLCVGCAPALHVATLSPTRHPPRSADAPVRIYSVQRPSCPFEELAFVRAEQRSALNSLDDVAEAMRAKARQLGGDAIVGLSSGTEIRGTGTGDGPISLHGDAVLSATVIRFTKPDCRE